MTSVESSQGLEAKHSQQMAGDSNTKIGTSKVHYLQSEFEKSSRTAQLTSAFISERKRITSEV